MINLQFSISNPWADDRKFDNLFNRSALLTKNKAVEFEICKDPSVIFSVGLLFTVNRDHAGFTFDIALFSYIACFRLYDTRHWDHRNNCWEVYDDTV